MGKYDNLLEKIANMDEEQAKELLAEILISYGDIGTIGHNENKFIIDVKRIYLRLSLRK